MAEIQTMPTNAAGGAQPKVTWDDSKMRTTYANVCNIATTREEVMLLFGTSQNWTGKADSVVIGLTDRILLNPHAAKRLMQILQKTLGEYEAAYGTLT